jgi:site-specific DNA-methyltransferase (adenine-specific)
VVATSNPDDLVMDPFCGSGTTGVVCATYGREFIGIERNPECCEIANSRIEQSVSGLVA